MPARLPSQAVRDAITGPKTQVTRRIEIYEADNKTPWKKIDQQISRLIDGSVTVDATRDERRGIDLTLDNTDFALTPSPYDGFWYDKIIVPYRGVILPDATTYEVPLGRFLIDNANEDEFPDVIKITGRDFTKKMLLSEFSTSLTFVAGTDISQLVVALAANSGVLDCNVPYDGAALLVDYTFDQGSNRWNAAKQIATDYNYDLYIDCYGTLILTKKVDPILSPVNWTFNTGSSGNLATISRAVEDTALFNHLIVIGGSLDSSVPPVYAELINDEPSSPTNVKQLGDRVTTYTNESLVTTDQCMELAKQMLKVIALETYQLNISSIVFPWLEANTVVEILDPKASVTDPKNYLMDTLSIPLTLAAMPATGKRVTVVGTTVA